MNLSHFKIGIDDLIDIKKEPLKCLCGKTRLDFKITTHYRHKISSDNGFVDFSSLYNTLECNYQSLQIFQNFSGLVKIFYATKSENVHRDLVKIKSFLGSNNLEKIEFESSKYFQIGRKRYSIWKDEFVSINDFFLN